MNIIIAVVLLIFGVIFGLLGANSYYYFYNFSVRATILVGIGGWMHIGSIILIVAAVKLNSNPIEYSKWGAVILIFSILMASILGIIGSIFALALNP